jgi:hypothetical protein
MTIFMTLRFGGFSIESRSGTVLNEAVDSIIREARQKRPMWKPNKPSLVAAPV